MLNVRSIVAAAAITIAVVPTSMVSASVDSTDAIRDLATEAAALVRGELDLITQLRVDDARESATAAELRTVDQAAHSRLLRLVQFGVEVTPAIRTAMGLLPPPGPTSGIATEAMPPAVVYEAAIDDLLRIAAKPDAVAPVASTSTGQSFGLLAVAAISLVVLGLAALGNTLRRRGDDEELAAMAWSDGLTGLANRRRLDHDLSKYRGDAPTAAIMVDVDHFKTVNDTYGHRVGDEVLRQVATMLTHHVRFDDVVYRYGGEEFCILLPDASIDDARTVADRVVEAARTITLPDSSHITVSIGVADGSSDVDDVLANADGALLEAKRSGRDCAVTAAASELSGA
jgi:diguanylate cyclase (GGDEF)-like protein